MRMNAEQLLAWQKAKADLLVPIIYVRGFALTGGEIDDTSADPFNGFNLGSTLVRTGWTGDSARHIFESPILRLTQPPYGYRLVFSDGICGLDNESKWNLRGWAEAARPQGAAAGTGGPTPQAVIAIYRYYDAASRLFGTGKRAGMEAYAWGLGRLILDVLATTKATSVYLVAHSMGGLVARAFLQNKVVLDDTNSSLKPEQNEAVRALLDTTRSERISQEDWTKARAAVSHLFTYGTPHNGISAQGGLGNWLLGPADSMLGLELSNFEQTRMLEYLDRPQRPNSLDGHFPIERTFCLVGTGAADYPVAGGLSRRLVGPLSDGLVETGNAVACGPPKDGKVEDVEGYQLAASAYVRRAHSGPYGMVNSEEGFGNLSRFLFGDKRVDGELIVREIDLPVALEDLKKDRKQQGKGFVVNASYNFEAFLRVRGERWAMTERVARDGSAIFRRYDELLGQDPANPNLINTDEMARKKVWHKQVTLFTAFLDTKLRTRRVEDEVDLGKDIVKGREIKDALGFALRLRVAVPEYEVDGQFWQKTHYEGSALLDTDLAFLAYPADVGGGWGLAWGPNAADGTNSQLDYVTVETSEPPGPVDETAYRRLLRPDAVEFWLPIREAAPPRFRAWLHITARQWNGATD